MKRLKVLVFPGGTEIGLEIQRALGRLKEVRLYSAGQDLSNHAPFVFARHAILPGVNEEGWLEALVALCREQSIDYVYPAHDDVLLALSRHADEIPAGIITSPLETTELTRSKSSTYARLAGTVPVPHTYGDPANIEAFPVFVKPDRGQGSQGTALVHSRAQLLLALEHARDPIALEYLPGEEVTVDCFSDRERGLLWCRGRRRVRTRAGISVNTVDAHEPKFEELARAITSKISLWGAWFFQLKRSVGGVWALLEVAPRIAGTSTLHRVQGINLAMLSLYEAERVSVSISPTRLNVTLDRAFTNRYATDLEYQTVYVDLDDTLILDGAVNVQLVRFLYQCVNRDRRIVLLTRHAGDLATTLARHRISELFDQVVHLTREDEKAPHITDRPAIFIDDSFAERAAVGEACGIPTFDCSMLEVLLDERQ